MQSIEELSIRAEEGAKGYFREGLNCAECALKGYLDLGLSDLPPEITALASGLGGGIGMTKNTCGAVLGAALAIGTKRGRKNPKAKETVEERVAELNDEDGIYQVFRRFIEEVEAKYGTIFCRELTKDFEWGEKARKKMCQEIVGHCAGLSVKYALEVDQAL